MLSLEKAGYAVGQKIDVKYLGKNEKGQMRLSRRAVLMRDSGTDIASGNSTDTSTLPPPKPTISSIAESSY